MYACLHLPPSFGGGASRREDLIDLALQFSPAVEETSADTVVFSIAPLTKLFGTPHALASEIGRYGNERKLNANLAIAANPDTAVMLARHCAGVTFTAPGRESEKLGSFVLSDLFLDGHPIDPSILELLERWGVKMCGDLAVLPEKRVAERLGPAGVHLRNLALGRVHRPLRLISETTKYEERVQLDEPVDTLEPLLFLFSGVLHQLCAKLRSQSQAARQLRVKLFLSDAVLETEARPLEPNREFLSQLEFPVPLDDSRSMLKILQLHLERHGPQAPVNGFALQIDPVAPRRLQSGLFLPPTPAPDKLQITISRLAGLVGEENVGSPELLNTHRPDAFRLRPLVVDPVLRPAVSPSPLLRLSLRIFRPALHARVRLEKTKPREVFAAGVEGRVLEAAGPWRTSGDWWTTSMWARDEWDVELSDGALYRIYCESRTKDWYVQAVYD